MEIDALLPELGALMVSNRDTILLRARDGADLQRLVDVLTRLADAGYETLVLVE